MNEFKEITQLVLKGAGIVPFETGYISPPMALHP